MADKKIINKEASVKTLIPPFYGTGKTLVETRLSDRLPEDFVKGIKNREDFDTFHAWLKSVPVSDRTTGRALSWDEKNKRERERMSNAVAYIKRTRFPDVKKHDKGKVPSVKETPGQVAKREIAEQSGEPSEVELNVKKHDKGKAPSVKETPEQVAKREIAEQSGEPTAAELSKIELEHVAENTVELKTQPQRIRYVKTVIKQLATVFDASERDTVELIVLAYGLKLK